MYRRPVKSKSRIEAELLEPRRLLSTIYVDVAASGPSFDGSSWSSAYPDLQQALATATAGDQIHVAQGTYNPTSGTDRTATFQLKSGVAIYGGYAGSGGADPNTRDVPAYPTVLSGDIGVAGDSTDNSYHVVTGSGTDGSAVLDGFTITAAKANGTGTNQAFGGGMINLSGSPSIAHCTFNSNAASAGGGILNLGSSPALNDCAFISNTASSSGGGGIESPGTSRPTLSGCTFTGNTAAAGGGASLGAASFTDCIFNGNSAATGGACNGGSYLHCTFIENSATNTGGAVSSAASSFSDCIFTNNRAGPSSSGGAIYISNSGLALSVTLTDCLFTGNNAGHAGGFGGAIYFNDSSATVAITCCTFNSNAANLGGAIYNRSATMLTNCIFNGNAAQSDFNGYVGFGGAIVHDGNTLLNLSRCTFIANTSNGGGALDLGGGSPVLTDCAFIGNTVSDWAYPGQLTWYGSGGAIRNQYSSPQITGCIFAGNATGNVFGFGGAIDNEGPAVGLINCTFSGNIATWGGAIANSAIPSTPTNCVFWGDVASTDVEISGLQSVLSSDIQGGFAGTGNIDADPQFVRNPSPGIDGVWGTGDDDYGDLRLRATSPCIDAGDNSAVPSDVTIDLAGKPRFIDIPGVNDPGAIVDIGAYERQMPVLAGSGSFVYDAPHQAIQITFSDDVSPASLAAGDLLLQNTTTNTSIDCSSAAAISYDANTRTATWTFSSPLPDGNYHATLGKSTVHDTLGDPLGQDFSFDFFSLAGDANHDRVVDVTDLGILATNWQSSGKTFVQGDSNYDGVVDVTDLGILATNWQKSMSASPADITSRRATTTSFSVAPPVAGMTQRRSGSSHRLARELLT